MHLLGSRSTAPRNVAEYRHPMFFRSFPDFAAAEKAHNEAKAALAAWEHTKKGKKPKAHPAPDLTQYKGTERDTVWRFRKSSVESDEEAILNLQIEGKDENLSRLRAELMHFTVSWEGPALTVPPDYTVGDFEGSDNEALHELAGQAFPCETAWLGLLPDELTTDAFTFLRKLHERRSAEAEATFPAVLAPVADADAVVE